MPINEKDYNRILNELNKEFEHEKDKTRKVNTVANAIIIVLIGLFLGWLAIVGATQ